MNYTENLEIDLPSFRRVIDIALKLNKMIAESEEIIEQRNAEENKASYTLSKYGWYISEMITLPEFFKINHLFEVGRTLKAEKKIADHYRKNYEQIIRRIISKNKDKRAIIEEASKAHVNEMYFASTILFLSLADGICDGKIFVREDKKLLTIDKEFTPDIVYETLGKQSAIDEDSRVTRSNYFSELNRHKVMHGLNFDYGNELNSLKALSLLSFVANFTNRFSDTY